MPVIELVDGARGEQRAIGQVTCPNCRVVMRLVLMQPVDGESCLHEVSYRCPRCSAETRRWVSR